LSAGEIAALEAAMGTTGSTTSGNTDGFNLDGTYDFRNNDSNVSGGSDTTFDTSGSTSNAGGSSTNDFTTATDLGNGLYAIDNGDGSYSIVTEDGVSMGSVGGGLEGVQDWEGGGTKVGVPNVYVQRGNEAIGSVNEFYTYPELGGSDSTAITPSSGGDKVISSVPDANTLVVGTDSSGNPVTLADINSLFPTYGSGAATAAVNTGVVSDASNGLGASVLPGSSVSPGGADVTTTTVNRDPFTEDPYGNLQGAQDANLVNNWNNAVTNYIGTTSPSIYSPTSNPGYGPNPFSNAGNATAATPDTSGTYSGFTPEPANRDIPVVDLGPGSFGGGGGGGGLGKYDYDFSSMAYARGGAAHTINGLSDLGSYSDGGRLLRGPGDGVSDSIPAVIGNKQPARLADGEFVIPARIVSELGNGSTEAGARKLYAMMDRIQATRKSSTGQGNVAKNTRADKYLPA
jgi:hypothetical protein